MMLFYQDFNEQFAAKVLKNHEIYKFTRKYFDTSEKKLLLRLFNSCKSSVNSKIDKIQRLIASDFSAQNYQNAENTAIL